MKKIDVLVKPSLKYKKEIFINKRSYTEYIALVTILFLTGSYLNNFIILFYFNIDVSNYFDAKDYITSSSTILGSLILSIFITTILLYPLKKIIIQSLKKDTLISIVIKTILLLLLLLLYYLTTALDFMTSTIFILLAFLLLIFTMKSKDTVIGLTMFAVSFFYLQIYFISIIEVEKIYKHKNEIYFYLDKNTNIDINSKKFIKSISKYTFFYDEQNKKTIVIPNSDILRIEKHHKESIFNITSNMLERYQKKIQLVFNNSLKVIWSDSQNTDTLYLMKQ